MVMICASLPSLPRMHVETWCKSARSPISFSVRVHSYIKNYYFLWPNRAKLTRCKPACPSVLYEGRRYLSLRTLITYNCPYIYTRSTYPRMRTRGTRRSSMCELLQCYRLLSPSLVKGGNGLRRFS